MLSHQEVILYSFIEAIAVVVAYWIVYNNHDYALDDYKWRLVLAFIIWFVLTLLFSIINTSYTKHMAFIMTLTIFITIIITKPVILELEEKKKITDKQ